MTVISLDEFAEKIGKSPRQVRRYIHDGIVQGIRGKYGYTIPIEELHKFEVEIPQTMSEGGTQVVQPEDMSQERTASVPGADAPAGERNLELRLALEGLRTAQQQTAYLLENLNAALMQKERAERQLEIMRDDLQKTRFVLTEQAESLAQKGVLESQLGALASENERQRLLWEIEREQLQAELTRQTERVMWHEKRIPRWVRKMFGVA